MPSRLTQFRNATGRTIWPAEKSAFCRPRLFLLRPYNLCWQISASLGIYSRGRCGGACMPAAIGDIAFHNKAVIDDALFKPSF